MFFLYIYKNYNYTILKLLLKWNFIKILGSTNSSTYLQYNNCVFANINNRFLLLLKKESKILNIFFKSIYSSTLKYYQKFLIIKGMGYKFISETNNTLQVKYGFSHKIIFKFSNYITIFIKNKSRLLQVISCYSNILSNFIFKLKNLRQLNRYIKKGIFENNFKYKRRKNTKELKH